MSMEDKVDMEIERDAYRNGGRTLTRVLGIVALHGRNMSPGDPQYSAISEAIGSDSEARVVEWQGRAYERLLSLPPAERTKLEQNGRKQAWQGSDEVTDINEYRKLRIEKDDVQ